jgi:prepilin peptidase CpaA
MHGLTMDRPELTGAVLLAVLCVACWTDLTTRRIPNWVTVPGMLLGVGLHALQGFGPLAGALLGVAFAFLVGLPFFIGGLVGGGDAKLLMAVGGFFGPAEFVWAALAIAIAGGVLGLVEAARQGVLRSVLSSCGRLLLGWVSFGPRAGFTLAPRRPLAMPYGVAIAAGSAFWWFFGASVV